MRIASVLFCVTILIALGTASASAKKPEPSPLWESLLKFTDAGASPIHGALQTEDKLVHLKNLSLQVPNGAYLLEKDAVSKMLGSSNRPWHLDFLECALLVPSASSEKPRSQNEPLAPGLYLVWFIHPRSGVPFVWSNRAISVVRKVIGTTGAEEGDFSGIHPTTFYTTIFTETHAYRFHFEYTLAHGNIVLVGHADRNPLPSDHDKTLISTASPAQAKAAADILSSALKKIVLEGLDPTSKDINAWIHDTVVHAKRESWPKFDGKDVALPESMQIITVLGDSLYSVDTAENLDVEYRVLGNIVPAKNGSVSGTLFFLVPREPRLENPSLPEQKEYLVRVSNWLPWIEADKLDQVVSDGTQWLTWRKPWLTGPMTIENALFLRWTEGGFVGFQGEARFFPQSKSEDDQKRIRAAVEATWAQLLQAISKIEAGGQKSASMKARILSIGDTSEALIAIINELDKKLMRAGYRLTGNLTEEEKAFLLVFWMMNQVDNGGCGTCQQF